jgi:hypothetical protein
MVSHPPKDVFRRGLYISRRLTLQLQIERWDNITVIFDGLANDPRRGHPASLKTRLKQEALNLILKDLLALKSGVQLIAERFGLKLRRGARRKYCYSIIQPAVAKADQR